MASRIQGITVEIGGDTTKLTTALKGVNSEIRNTQSQLRDVEKLLKLDPGNTELLSQKQRILNQEVQATKEKLEALKTASEQANAALEQGTITQSQYDALQREIIATEQALEELEEQAEQSAAALQKISATGTKFQEIGGKIEGVGKSLLPMSAAVTGIGVAGLKVATDFEKAMSGVKAITGATGEDFEKLRETAIDLGATTAFSSGEAAEAMTEMAKAGWSATQIIDGMAGVLDATAASGESLGSVATIVADAITGFGLSAKDSARVADLLTQAANSGTIGVSDLGESYKYVAPLAQSMGLSIEDVTTAISAMSMAGIKGSQAGTSLRTVLANMAKPSSTVANAMNELNLSITNSDGSFKSLDEIVTAMRTSFSGLTDDQKAYYATALAGKEGMSGLISLLNLTQEEYDGLSASMKDCSGIAVETAAVMQDNLQSKVEQLGGALESLAIKLSEYVIPFLTGLVEKITAAVDAFTNMNPVVQKAVLVIGGILAVAGPLLIFVGKVISAVGTIMTLVPKAVGAIHAVKGAFSALGVVMAANPIVLVVGAVAAAVAALILLYNKCAWFRDVVNAVWKSVKDFFVQTWQVICSFFTETIPDAWNSLAAFFQAIPAWWSGLWQGISDFFGNIWSSMMNNPVLSQITSLIQNLWRNLVSTLQGIWSGLVSIASGAWELLKNTILAPVLLLIDLVTGNFSQLALDASQIWMNMKNAASQIWSGIGQMVSSLAQGFVTHVSTLFSGLRETASQIWSSMRSGASDFWSWLGRFVTETAGNLYRNAVQAFQNMVSGIGSALGNLGSVVSSGFQSAIRFITSLPSQAFAWGMDFINGIANGIRNAIGNVVSAVSSVAETIRSYLHFSVPDIGPLTDYENWMPDFMSGLAKGIERSRDMVAKAVDGVASDMVIRPQMAAAGYGAMKLPDRMSAEGGLSGITSAITEAISQLNGQSGDIVIPVYLGGTMLDEVIVNAQQRANLRSGGR